MRIHRAPARRRGGFTLVEILVVVTIIALLVGLFTSGIIVTLNKLDEVKARNEISALAASVKQFETDYNIAVPPPSRLYIDETGQYNPAVNFPGWGGLSAAQQNDLKQLATDSQAYFVKLWPRVVTSPFNSAQPLRQIDWNGNSAIDPQAYLLEGEQCLVFFLGGARANGTTGAFVGFSTTATNPMAGGGTRKGPYFQFDMARIQPLNNVNTNLPWYIDPYGIPYAYFSSGKGSNRYNAYPNLGFDCPSLQAPTAGGPTAIQPYFQSGAGSAAQFYNPDTFQIISAGKDMKFGPGGLWVSSMGTGGMATAGALTGADDLTNFYDAKLGVSP